MSLSADERDIQARLKFELQDEKRSSNLEDLAAALLGRLLEARISVAKSGFQREGDSGRAGRQERRFRLECKKYKDATSDQELCGEIDHAIARDEALEAWVLIALCSVPYHLEQTLTQKGEKIGVPVVVIDWMDHELASLAALCAFDPDLVEAKFSKEAGVLARALQPVSGDAITALRRNLQSWRLGFGALRTRSHEKLDKIWTRLRKSNDNLGQNVTGGAQGNKVKRTAVHGALNAWWNGPARKSAPVVVIGWDGVGKTWVALDWLIDSKCEQPIILFVPSSAAADFSCVSEISVKRFLAERLYEITGVLDPEHWMGRLNNLLKRPTDEGVVLSVFFDGMNQEPSVPWLSFLNVLQGEEFEGRVRVIASTETHHFKDRLSKLRELKIPAVPVEVDLYDTEPGGELDQMLAFEGLSQADLRPTVIELACLPRHFRLVVRFGDWLVQGHGA